MTTSKNSNTVSKTSPSILQNVAVTASTTNTNTEIDKECNGAPKNTITDWQQMGITNPDTFKSFYTHLNELISTDNRTEIADLLQYPLNTDLHGTDAVYLVKNKTEFLNNYDKLFTSNVKKMIKNANIDCSILHDGGVGIGNGTVWFAPSISPDNGTYRIISLFSN